MSEALIVSVQPAVLHTTFTCQHLHPVAVSMCHTMALLKTASARVLSRMQDGAGLSEHITNFASYVSL